MELFIKKPKITAPDLIKMGNISLQSIWLSHSQFILYLRPRCTIAKRKKQKKKHYMPNNVKIKHSLKYLPIGNRTCCCCCCYYGNFCFLFLPSPFWFLCVLCVRLCWYSGRKSKSTCSAWPIGGNRGEVNRVRSSFSTFFFSTFGFHFLRGVAWVVEKEMEEIYVSYVCLHSTFYAPLWLYFFLSFCFYKFCQFALFTFSPLMTSSTLGTHTHTHKHTNLWKRLRKKWPRTPKIYTHLKLCVCPFFFCTCTGPFFYENFWRDLILAPSQF